MDRISFDVTEVNFGPVGFEWGYVAIGRTSYSLSSVTFGPADQGLVPVDIGIKTVTLAEGLTPEAFRGLGTYAEAYAGLGYGRSYNASNEPIAEYTGFRSDVTVGFGGSLTKVAVHELHYSMPASVGSAGGIGIHGSIPAGTEFNGLDALAEAIQDSSPTGVSPAERAGENSGTAYWGSDANSPSYLSNPQSTPYAGPISTPTADDPTYSSVLGKTPAPQSVPLGSWKAPVDAPEGTAARPKDPSESVTSTSTVGLPRLSSISNAAIFWILDMVFLRKVIKL